MRLFDACSRDNGLLLFLGNPRSGSVDLSKATKLKDVVFRPGPWKVEWVIAALQTITPNHRDLRQITIRIPHHLTHAGALANIRRSIGEAHVRLWLDLDLFLAQLWETRSIRTKVVCTTERSTGVDIGCLFPEMTKRGILDLVEYDLLKCGNHVDF
jgi:hypothetical protein